MNYSKALKKHQGVSLQEIEEAPAHPKSNVNLDALPVREKAEWLQTRQHAINLLMLQEGLRQSRPERRRQVKHHSKEQEPCDNHL